MTTTEEMVAMRVEGGVTAGTREGRELRGKAREAELALEGQAVGVGGKEVVRLAAGKGAEGMASGRAEEGRKALDNMGRGSFGQGGRHAAQVLAAKVTTEVLEVKGISENVCKHISFLYRYFLKKMCFRSIIFFFTYYPSYLLLV